MDKYKIGSKEAIAILLTITIARTFVSLPTYILYSMKSATILNILYVGIIAILITILIYKLMKNFKGLDIIDISETLGGNLLKNIIGSIFIIYFIITSSTLLRNFSEGIKTVYYPMTNTSFIILLFVVCIIITNRLSFNASLKTTLIVIPMVLVSIVFIFLAISKDFVFERMFPVLGEGLIPTFVTGLENIFSFAGIGLIYFLPPLLKEPEKFKKISLISTGISLIYLLLIFSTLLFMFTFYTNSREIMPLYGATRFIEFGTFFQRLESVFLLIWIMAFACYLSIISKFAINIFKKITKISDSKPLIYPFGLLMLAIALTPKNFAVSYFIETTVYKYIAIGIIFILVISVLLLANLKRKKLKVE